MMMVCFKETQEPTQIVPRGQNQNSLSQRNKILLKNCNPEYKINTMIHVNVNKYLINESGRRGKSPVRSSKHFTRRPPYGGTAPTPRARSVRGDALPKGTVRKGEDSDLAATTPGKHGLGQATEGNADSEGWTLCPFGMSRTTTAPDLCGLPLQHTQLRRPFQREPPGPTPGARNAVTKG